MAELNVTLTNEQQEIVDYEGEELLIRGIAGSGKSLILFKKAEATARKYPDRKVIIFTYNRSLANASKKLAERLKVENLYVSTFHSWAMRVYRKVMRKNKLYMKNYNHNFLDTALDKLEKTEIGKHRFFNNRNKYKGFINEEISWIKGRGIQSFEEYKKASRRGRGSEVRVTKEDREIIYEIFKGYNQEKDYILDYDDIGFDLYKRIDEIKNDDKYDYVFVDEAQDLQQVQLFILRKIAKEAFYVAADIGQKIYKTSFTWRDIGLNVTGGRTKVLRDSFRSTKQIIELANSLQSQDSIINDEEFVSAELPEREGPKPLIIECSTRNQQIEEVIRSAKEILNKNPKRTVGILIKERKKVYGLSKHLNQLGISHDNILNNDADTYSPGIKLCTIHSSKGLQFDAVIIIDLNEPNLEVEMDNDEYWDGMRRLLYVGLTRAITFVQLFYYTQPMRILSDLDEKFYEKVTI